MGTVGPTVAGAQSISMQRIETHAVFGSLLYQAFEGIWVWTSLGKDWPRY